MILSSLKFWPKVMFWVYERRRGFIGSRKKQRDFWGLRKKGLRDFLGYAKKRIDFYWQTNSEIVISLGIKYKPLSYPPPPPPPPSSLKFVSGAPGSSPLIFVHRIAHKAIVTSKQNHNFARFRK